MTCEEMVMLAAEDRDLRGFKAIAEMEMKDGRPLLASIPPLVDMMVELLLKPDPDPLTVGAMDSLSSKILAAAAFIMRHDLELSARLDAECVDRLLRSAALEAEIEAAGK